MTPSGKSFFSVIICSIDALKFAHVSACYEQLLTDFPHEIIGIHDARSLAEGYNRALRRARGDIIIFSHDDILILDPDFAWKISHRLQNFDILGVVGTHFVIAESWWCAGFPWLCGAIAHPLGRRVSLNIWNPKPWPVVDDIQGIDGLCIMACREVAEEIGFDEATFDGFHLYDLDFSFSAWRAGKKLGVCCDIPVIHASTGRYGKEHTRYGRLFIEKHKDALSVNTPIIDKITGMAADLSNYRALRAAWQEDVLLRSWIACQRRRSV
jgi:glycosyltransferase involved in cell wall biosynthesis